MTTRASRRVTSLTSHTTRSSGSGCALAGQRIASRSWPYRTILLTAEDAGDTEEVKMPGPRSLRDLGPANSLVPNPPISASRGEKTGRLGREVENRAGRPGYCKKEDA